LDLRGEFQISPDARYVAVIPSEGREQLVIWDLESQTKTCTLSFEGPIARRFSSGPLNLEFFPETNLFLFNGRAGPEGPTTSTNQIRLMDLENCQVLFEMNPRLWPILAVSPDGRYLAYSQDDPSGTIRRAYLFDTQEKSEERVGDDLNLAGLGFTNDSQAVIVSYPYMTKIYDLSSREVLAQTDTRLAKNEQIGTYPLQDGHRILFAGFEYNFIWDYTNNKSFSLSKDLIAGYRESFDDRNGVIVTSESIWNLDQKNRVALTDYPYGRDLSALSKDGSYAAVDSGYAPYQIDLLETATGRLVSQLPGERTPVAVGDGASFITSGDGQIFVRSFSSGELLDTFQGRYMNGIPLTGQQVLIWDAAGGIAILDTGTGRILKQADLPILPIDYGRVPDYYTFQHSFPIWEESLGFDPSAWLTSAGRNTQVVSPDHAAGIQQYGNSVQIHSIQGENFFPTAETLLASYGFKGVWLQFAFSPDGKQVVGFTNSQLIVWDSQTGRQIRGVYGKSYLQGRTTDFGFAPDGSRLLVSSIRQDGRSLTILDVKTGAQVQSHEVPDCNLNIPYAVTADGSQVFTITQDCRIGLFNIADWQEVKSFGGPYSGAELALALSPDGKFLAAGYKQSLEIWDVPSGKLVKSFNDLDTHIENFIGDFSLAFSPDGKLLAARYGRSFYIGSTVILFGVPAAP
jgi:WD40 repeat protein